MKPKRILVVDDERRIVDVVVYVLEQNGLHVITAPDGDTGLRLFREREPDLVLLDLKLPGLSGMDLFREMRQLRPHVPVIMISSKCEEVDRIVGLEIGADDYVTKPFSPRELAARVCAVLRRADRLNTAQGTALRYGPLELEADTFRLTFFGQQLVLTRPEFRLMEALIRHPARVYTRDTLIRLIYDDQNIVTDRSIDAYVKRLRRKFVEIRANIDPVETVYGIGYKLNQRIEERT
jgi:DNA-binding response OmpR family regulator